MTSALYIIFILSKVRDFNRFLIFVMTYPKNKSLKNQDFSKCYDFALYIIFILSKVRDFNTILNFCYDIPKEKSLKNQDFQNVMTSHYI